MSRTGQWKPCAHHRTSQTASLGLHRSTEACSMLSKLAWALKEEAVDMHRSDTICTAVSECAFFCLERSWPGRLLRRRAQWQMSWPGIRDHHYFREVTCINLNLACCSRESVTSRPSSRCNSPRESAPSAYTGEHAGRGRLPVGTPEFVAFSLKGSVSTLGGPRCPFGAVSVSLPWSGSGFLVYPSVCFHGYWPSDDSPLADLCQTAVWNWLLRFERIGARSVKPKRTELTLRLQLHFRRPDPYSDFRPSRSMSSSLMSLCLHTGAPGFLPWPLGSLVLKFLNQLGHCQF